MVQLSITVASIPLLPALQFICLINSPELVRRNNKIQGGIVVVMVATLLLSGFFRSDREYADDVVSEGVHKYESEGWVFVSQKH